MLPENVPCDKEERKKSNMTQHCCESMTLLLEDPKMPLEYYPIAREYGIPLYYSPAMQRLIYCPWCGEKLPKSLRDKFFEILEKEYNVEPEFDVKEDPNVPEEFKSDAWWKKRGL